MAILDRVRRSRTYKLGAVDRMPPERYRPRPETMAAPKAVKVSYGGVAAWLTDNGLHPGELDSAG